MKIRLIVLAAIVSAVSVVTAISFGQRRPDDQKPITGDFKITIKTTMAGMPTQSTTMIKGLRERSETNMSVAGMNMSQTSIAQCDLRRTIQINDRARKYMISPMETDESGASTSSADAATISGPSRSGGVVTMIVNTTDTGERKEMFGFTARHMKRTTMSQSSPDACHQQQMKIDTDGWYINLEYGLSCPTQRPPQRPGMASPGCRDRYQYKHNGPSNLGYPLVETTTMYGSDGSATFSMTKEVVELSRQTLDAALFDVPAGYTLANSQQEMNGAPSMAEIMAMAGQQPGQTNSESGQSSMAGMPSASKTTGKARVGVVELNNKTKSSVATDSLREQLVAALSGDGVDAISLNASSASEAEIEAKAKGCGYILYTDISSLKAASTGKKIGGLLGRASGVGSSDTGKSEARLDFRLIPVGSSSPTLQSSASTKEDTQEASVSSALQSEAKAVAASVNKM